MGLSALMEATIRKFTGGISSGVQRGFRLTGQESLAVAEVELRLLEAARAGMMFYGASGAVTNAQAPVQDIPTTAAMWMLYNGESPGGLTYAIDWVHIYVASGTSGIGWTTLLCPLGLPQTAITANGTGVIVANASAGSRKKSKGFIATAPTLIGGTYNWFPITANGNAAAATPGSGGPLVNVDGRILIPPQGGLAIAVLSGAGTSAKFGFGLGWMEVNLGMDLE